jgi:REase_DpnII-MboI
MVSVTGLSLLGLRRDLREAATDTPHQPAHARAFTAWIQHETLHQSPLLKALADDAAAAVGPVRETMHAAVLGYAVHMDRVFSPPFIDAIDWLRQRQYFSKGRPHTFEVDGLGLLGVAVGLKRVEAAQRDESKGWLNDLLRRSLDFKRPNDWNESLIAAAYSLTVNDLEVLPNRATADLQAALCSKGLVPTSAALRASAWDIISRVDTSDDGMTRAAAQSAALAYLLRDASTLRFGSVTVEDVARLLQGVTRSMRYWAWESEPRTANSALARWNVENEYHVQDMLGVILAPYFPELDDEEWLRSLGQHHPRADFAMPSLNLFIEVKFLRQATNAACSKVIQEVAADASTYLQEGGSYRHIIAFVWDDSAS